MHVTGDGAQACVGGTCTGTGSPGTPDGIPWCHEEPLDAVVAGACIYDDDGNGVPDGVAEAAEAGAGVFLLAAGAGHDAEARDLDGDGVPESARVVPVQVIAGYYVPQICIGQLPPVCFYFVCVVCVAVVVEASDPNGDGVPNRVRASVPSSFGTLVDETVTV